MSRHPSKVVECEGPLALHAFDVIPIRARQGNLDAICPTCEGHGQWNTEIDLVSLRSKRRSCDHCYGQGWIETGNDPVLVDDIIMTPDGYPKWIRRPVKENV